MCMLYIYTQTHIFFLYIRVEFSLQSGDLLQCTRFDIRQSAAAAGDCDLFTQKWTSRLLFIFLSLVFFSLREWMNLCYKCICIVSAALIYQSRFWFNSSLAQPSAYICVYVLCQTAWYALISHSNAWVTARYAWRFPPRAYRPWLRWRKSFDFCVCAWGSNPSPLAFIISIFFHHSISFSL